MSRFRPGSQPRTRTIVRFSESQAAAQNAAALGMQLDRGEVVRPGLRNPEQLYGFPSPGAGRHRAAPDPDIPNSSPKTPTPGNPEPEQLYGSRRPDPEQAPVVIGEEQPQTRRNPSPRPRKSPIQAPNPNKSTGTSPRADPEDRLLPPHGVCGTILPHPLYHLLYFVCHVR